MVEVDFRLKILLFSASILCMFTSSVFGLAPSWLKNGSYVRYDLKSSGIIYSNRTLVLSNSRVSFRWECVNMKGDIAELNLSLSLNETAPLTTQVFVDTLSREVSFSNGTVIGQTLLWLPANPVTNETILLTNKVAVTAEVSGWSATCQGGQQVFLAVNDTLFIGGFYDLDTGILVQPFSRDEPMLSAFNISDLGGIPYLAATNIDLGPRYWLPDLLALAPYLLIAVGLCATFVYVLRRQEKSRKNRKHR